MNESNNPESVYYYIASVNPDEAISLLTNNYGYSIVNNNVSTDDIAGKLYEIVQQDGQPALIDVMNLHPDKTMILELFATPTSSTAAVVTPAPTCAPVTMTAPSTIPAFPICGQGNNMNMDGNGKQFFNDPKNVMIAAVAVIALIAVFRPKS